MIWGTLKAAILWGLLVGILLGIFVFFARGQ